MLKKGNKRMIIELTAEQKEIVESALLRFNAMYEDKSELAYKTDDSKKGEAFMEYANEVFKTYQAIKKQ